MPQEQPVKTCPRCRLINPPEAERCDWGWDFFARRQMRSYLPRKTMTKTAAGVGGAVVLYLLAHVALMLLHAWSDNAVKMPH